MVDLLGLLGNLGLGIASNAIYDLLKDESVSQADKTVLEERLQNIINLKGVTMRAETVIKALAANGFLVIKGSQIHANKDLIFGSVTGSAIAGDGTKMSTDRTSIDAGKDAFVQTNGNAQVRQNSDGSISFHVGENGSDSVSFEFKK